MPVILCERPGLNAIAAAAALVAAAPTKKNVLIDVCVQLTSVHCHIYSILLEIMTSPASPSTSICLYIQPVHPLFKRNCVNAAGQFNLALSLPSAVSSKFSSPSEECSSKDAPGCPGLEINTLLHILTVEHIHRYAYIQKQMYHPAPIKPL